MERWLATQIKYSEFDLADFKAKIASDKTKFEDTVEYKNLKKDLENAQKAYDQSLTDTKMDEESYLEILEQAQSVFSTLVNSQVVIICEDSVEICPQLGYRVLFVKHYHKVDLLNMRIIQLAKPFYFDTGTECITITKDNYKDFDIDKILIEKPEKYKEVSEINH